ncbi:hypothetical protein CYLTODRAFT_435252 [Cylindrobasidium torrendii FP15055 ss-10]|uniref:COP9 signalosome complex subunit 4 n=1 Tax=Cylindrobasidium torrendii FP15055 ss-10 TaxID=1314674 RepID=A0A0D7BLP2_9AGAR|nr:hypothetical protein CYLTODRAFT_435252 [Cylindrobasidium torrendii FP15055 ss-10]
MDAQLASIAAVGTRDQAPAYSSLLKDTFATLNPATILVDLHAFVNAIVDQDNLLVGRQILGEVVNYLKGDAFIKDMDLRKTVIQDVLNVALPKVVSYEEQVIALRMELVDILKKEEDWSEAARALIAIYNESSQRAFTDSAKLKGYIEIVRLLLEEEDSVQAETYFKRAQSLIGAAKDNETALSFRLSQARIFDYSRRFWEAARMYHELSYVGDIDEEDRLLMLNAAITCAVLAPAGPNRSRVLASLYRDERATELPTYNILSKMFLDHILRSAEIKQFEETLKPHQLAKIAISSNDKVASLNDDEDVNDPSISKRTGPSTVLDRAVMEHNLLASSKVYNNITFKGLGALLDLTPGAAETMARRMMKEGRLGGSIDQVDKLIIFENNREEDDAQGKAGGLGDVEEAEDTGAPLTKRWDTQIRVTAANVEAIVQHISEKGLLQNVGVAA